MGISEVSNGLCENSSRSQCEGGGWSSPASSRACDPVAAATLWKVDGLS